MQNISLVEQVQDENPAVRVLLSVLKMTDEATYIHSLSVASIVEEFIHLMEQCPWTEKEIKEIITGALLHDLGKAFIPFNIHSSSKELDFNTRIIMQSHPNIGFEIIRDNFGDIVEEIVLMHHEKADGSGYPFIPELGPLNEDNIPTHVILVSYADELDALLTPKPYRDGLSLETARDIIFNEIDNNKLSYIFKHVLLKYIEKNIVLE